MEVAAIEEPTEREKLFQAAVAQTYERGKALSMASYMEIDAVIDPAETRSFILRGIKSVPKTGPRRRFIDTW